MALAPDSNGRQLLTLTVDAAWLRDPARAFPVHLDLPVALAAQAAHSHLRGTVNSCTPNTPAAPTLVVGLEGNCTYHGLLRFDVAQLRGDSQVATATLRLYTPNQTGPTGVLVYPNAPAWQTEPRLGQPLPSWNGALAISGTVGIAQSASDGHWQSWDITSLVQQWIQHGRSYDTGITLVGTGTPVLFTSSPASIASAIGSIGGATSAEPGSVTPSHALATPAASAPISSAASGSLSSMGSVSPRARQQLVALHQHHNSWAKAVRAVAPTQAVWGGHRSSRDWNLLSARLGVRTRLRAHTSAVDGSVVSLVSVLQQCYLVPGAPNLCLPMMAPPDITVGPPAVSLPTPSQCYRVSAGTTSICIPVVNPNQPICVQTSTSVGGVCTQPYPIPTPASATPSRAHNGASACRRRHPSRRGPASATVFRVSASVCP